MNKELEKINEILPTSLFINGGFEISPRESEDKVVHLRKEISKHYIARNEVEEIFEANSVLEIHKMVDYLKVRDDQEE